MDKEVSMRFLYPVQARSEASCHRFSEMRSTGGRPEHQEKPPPISYFAGFSSFIQLYNGGWVKGIGSNTRKI